MTITRVHYRERQTLQAADLNDEQGYRLAMRRRHNIAGHAWGIVAGLALELGEDGFWVQPGYAIDGFGRELVVPEPVYWPWDGTYDLSGEQASTSGLAQNKVQNLFELLGSPLDEEQKQTISVWLLYQRKVANLASRAGLRVEAGQYSRWREESVLRLRPGGDVIPRLPPEVLGEDLEFTASQDPPDDSVRQWPIYLGKLVRTGEEGYDVDPFGRPYAALVAETIVSPRGGVRVQLTQDRGAPGRFAVSFPSQDEAEMVDRLAIDVADSTNIQTLGSVKVLPSDGLSGDLVLAEPQATFRASDIVDPAGLADRLRSASDRVAKQMPAYARSRLVDRLGSFRSPERLSTYLVAALNRMVKGDLLYDRRRFEAVALRPATRTVVSQGVTGSGVAAANRMLLEDAYSGYLATGVNDGPEARAIEFRPLAQPPAAAAPWRVYHTLVPPSAAPGSAPATAQAVAPTHELRFEIGDPGTKGDPARNRLAIGYWSTAEPNATQPDDPQPGNGQPHFYSRLAVQADGTVIVDGTLVARGQVIEGPIQADTRDPRFATALIQQTARGQVAGIAGDLEITGRIDTALKKLVITVINKGPNTISGIQVYESIAVDKVPWRQGAVGTPFTASPRPSPTEPPFTKSLESAFPTQIVGTVDANIVALGIGPGNQVVQASTSAQAVIS